MIKGILSKLILVMARYNTTFIGLLCFTLLLNLPYFLNFVSYYHDSLSYLTTFYTTYNNLFYHLELTQWFPYSVYGVHGDFFQMTLLTVVDYFVIVIGILLRVQEVLFLFKLSLLLEQFIFLLGMYLLAKQLFKQEVTVFFVCACAIGSLILSDQLFWGFRAFYLLPFMIHFLKLYFEKNKFRYLLIMMNVSLLAMAGSVPYYAVITLLVMSIIFLFLLAKHHRRWKEYLILEKKDASINFILSISFLALLSAYFYICFCRGDHIALLSEGRNLKDYTIPLSGFLSYGGGIGSFKFVDLISALSLRYPFFDITLYIGFIALFFIGYGIVKVRNFIFYAFLAIVVIIAFLSLGGMTSRILYHVFPGMHYYRHIGLSVTCFKIFLPLIAGFGLDTFLNNSRIRISIFGKWIIISCLLIGAWTYYNRSLQTPGQGVANLYIYSVIAILLTLILISKRFTATQFFKSMLIVGVCMELLGYQTILLANKNNLVRYCLKSFNRVHEDQFQAERTSYPRDQTTKEDVQRATLLLLYRQRTLYVHFYDAIQWDPEVPFFRKDFINSHVAHLLEARGAKLGLMDFLLPVDLSLQRALGCMSPKLKLISRVSFARDEKEAILQVKMIRNIDDVIVLNNVPLKIRSQWENYDAVQGGSVSVTDFSNNTLSLTAALPEKTMAWLYYADGFHPQWKAFVNGQPTPIFQANVGFKAILLNGGVNKIRFIYNNKPVLFSLCIFIVLGIIFVLICLLTIWKVCIQTKRQEGLAL